MIPHSSCSPRIRPLCRTACSSAWRVSEPRLLTAEFALRRDGTYHLGTPGARRVHTVVAFDAGWDQLLWMVDGNRFFVVDDDTAREAPLLMTCFARAAHRRFSTRLRPC